MKHLIIFFGYPKEIIKTTNTAFLSIVPYIILVNACISLTMEFENKTDKTIFTGIFSRTEIIISKLISFIVQIVVCFIAYELITLAFGTFGYKAAIDSFITFIIYAFTMGSFALLLSAITSNGILTGLITYTLHFDLMLTLLGKILERNDSKILKLIVNNSSFYIANTGFKLGKYTFQQALVMIISGILFLLGSCVIINKKNM